MGLFDNPHFQTIAPAFFRPSASLAYQRKTIGTDDDDFLDLDYFEKNQTHKIAVLVHGLEGNSQDHYITKTAEKLSSININSLCMNLRSCSGRMNKLARSYHSGKTEDLRSVINSIEQSYTEIYLIGFSVGGNTTLKYLGENNLDSRIKKAFSISAPLDLKSSAIALAKKETRIYMQNLLKNLRAKLEAKSNTFPQEISLKDFDEIKNFKDYDGRYTAPLNGFKGAEDYWQKASAKDLLENIQIPTTILSALDDPFLGPECFPQTKNPNLNLQYTAHGGHLGFIKFDNFKISFLYEEMILEEFQS